MIRVSSYRLTRQQERDYANVGEVRISIWGAVPEMLDALISTGRYGTTRAEVYYGLAMERLREIERAKSTTR